MVNSLTPAAGFSTRASSIEFLVRLEPCIAELVSHEASLCVGHGTPFVHASIQSLRFCSPI